MKKITSFSSIKYGKLATGRKKYYLYKLGLALQGLVSLQCCFLIKESSRAIAGPVAKILNTSIAQSRYPSRWKMGQVTPLFKKDEELDK